MKPIAPKKKVFIRFLNVAALFFHAVFFLAFYYDTCGGFETNLAAAQNTFLYLTFYVILTSAFGLYKIGTIRLVDVYSGLLFTIPGTNTLFLVQLWLTKDSADKGTPGLWFAVTLLQLAFGIVTSYLLHRSYLTLVPPPRLCAVAGNMPEDTILWNQRMENQYFRVGETVAAGADTEVILKKAKSCDGLLMGDLPVTQRNTLIRRCFCEGIPCFYMLKITDILVQNAEKYKLYDQVFLMNQNQGLSLRQEAVKRAMDLVLSVILLIFLSPLCLAVMFCIMREDHGTVLYRQKRITKGGREFEIYKFRSMRMDAEKDGPRLAEKGDGRITRTGQIIRNLHFDEIPQLLNVIKGDMSLVGPRPERRIFTEEYKKILPEFESRLKVKAGLTGYGQVYGNYNTNPYDKLKLDLIYINHYSLFLDLKLLLQTVRILFQKEHAEGVEEGQISALPLRERAAQDSESGKVGQGQPNKKGKNRGCGGNAKREEGGRESR